MKKATKIIIILVLLLSVAGVWGYKKYQLNNNSTNVKETVQESKPINNSSTNVNETVEENKPMLVDLGSGTCIPCKQMVPVLEDVKKTYEGKAVVKVIDVYDNPEETDKYNISVIPTQIFLDKDGKEFFRHEGFFSKEEIVKVFDKMGVK